MVTRGRFLTCALGAITVCLTVTACGSSGSSSSSSHTSTSTSTSSGPAMVSATRLNNDSALVDAALSTYTSQDASTLTSSDQLKAFVGAASADLTQLRTAFNTWSTDLDNVDRSEVSASSKQAYPLMLSYRDALDAWINEQVEENTTAAACLGQQTSLVVEACYQGAIAKYSSTTVDSRLTTTRQQLTTALGG